MTAPPPALDPGFGLRVSTDVVCRRLGESTVLVHLGTDEILRLNRTAGRLWELLTEGLTRRRILEQVVAEFEVGPEEVDAELDRLLAALAEADVLAAAADE